MATKLYNIITLLAVLFGNTLYCNALSSNVFDGNDRNYKMPTRLTKPKKVKKKVIGLFTLTCEMNLIISQMM